MENNKQEELKIAQEDWMVKKWRPAMGWTYMVICILDMAVFPVLWSLLQALSSGQVTSQWNPLTLQGAGLFHLAMGAVLGIAAWSRGQEKMAGAAVGGGAMPSSPMGSPMQSPQPMGLNTPAVAPRQMPMMRQTTTTTFDLDPGDPQVRNTRND